MFPQTSGTWKIRRAGIGGGWTGEFSVNRYGFFIPGSPMYGLNGMPTRGLGPGGIGVPMVGMGGIHGAGCSVSQLLKVGRLGTSVVDVVAGSAAGRMMV